MNTASEQELKLYVPSQRQASILEDLAQMSTQQVWLRARYFDTPQRTLAKHGVALRVRQENEKWVQTIKVRGAHVLEHLELNHTLATPQLNLNLYDGHPVSAILHAHRHALGCRYETHILRHYGQIQSSHGLVEIAFDTGHIAAGKAMVPVSELEFELLTGELAAVFLVGQQWLVRHHLSLEFRSKAERGDALAQTMQAPTPEDPTKTSFAPWPRSEQPLTCATLASRSITVHCLESIARDSALLIQTGAQKPNNAQAQATQKRLQHSLLRLQTIWKFFKPVASRPDQEPRHQTRQYLKAIHAERVPSGHIRKLLRRHALASLPAPDFGLGKNMLFSQSDGSKTSNLMALVNSVAFQEWLLTLFAWALDVDSDQARLTGSKGAAQPPSTEDVIQALIKRTKKWRKRMIRTVKSLPHDSAKACLRAQRQAWQLCYALEILQVFDPEINTKKARKAARHIARRLGRLHSLICLQNTWFEGGHKNQYTAFAQGWLVCHIEHCAQDVKRSLKTLSGVKIPSETSP